MSASAAETGPAEAPGAGSSYYGQPVLKEPVWTWEIPCYFFTGGAAGAGAGLAFLTGVRGNRVLARRCWVLALVTGAVSPVLLISDLGRPERFLNMLRMVKVTSPMSLGSWVLAATGPAAGVSTVNALTGAFPRLAAAARPSAALLGLPLSTYTAALIANTAVPVWHEARRELPFVFAAGAASSAGALACAATPVGHASPARRLAILGAAGELLAAGLMERRLGELKTIYEQDQAGRFARLAKGLTAAGAALVAARGARSRGAAVTGGCLIAAGALAERFSVFRAGFQSAADPRQVVGPQRDRIRQGRARGAALSA